CPMPVCEVLHTSQGEMTHLQPCASWPTVVSGCRPRSALTRPYSVCSELGASAEQQIRPRGDACRCAIVYRAVEAGTRESLWGRQSEIPKRTERLPKNTSKKRSILGCTETFRCLLERTWCADRGVLNMHVAIFATAVAIVVGFAAPTCADDRPS